MNAHVVIALIIPLAPPAPTPMASAPSAPPPSASRSPLSRGPMKPLAADVFKPRLPRDPFAPTHQRPQPWALKPDAVIAALNAPRRDVILVLGAPSIKDLEPLLQSAYLAHALLILATHAPPQLPAAAALPAVRILRLAAPLAIEDAGAVRFVNILEAAERIARVWRKAGGTGVEEVREADAGGAPDTPLAPPQARFASAYGSAPPSASSSTDNISVASSASRRRSFLSLPKSARAALPPVDAAQRPFDALLNFLPARAPDKATLKQMILVTTISRPFLTSAAGAGGGGSRSSSRLSVDGESRRWSLARPAASLPTTPASNRSRTSLFPPDAPQTPRRAHIVHLIAPTAPSVARSKLMQSIEGFLCSFAYPAPGLDAGGMGDERAAPFLMHPYTLKASITAPDTGVGAWSIADLLLSGCLDRPENGSNMARAPPRAWLSSANDIVLAPASRPVSQGSVSLPAVPSLQAPTPSPHRGRASQSFLGGAELGFVNANASSQMGGSASATWSGVRRPEISLDSTSARGKGKERAPPLAQGLPTPPDSSADSDSAESVRPPSPVPAPERKGSVRGRGFFGGGGGGGGDVGDVGGKKKGGGLGIRWKFWKTAAVRA
ncbi:hypothetical protein HWV62_20968 [Athelia sp. TMB]|nr:hypothetical protein HWV62_20968 [Athelia sp. TMB]